MHPKPLDAPRRDVSGGGYGILLDVRSLRKLIARPPIAKRQSNYIIKILYVHLQTSKLVGRNCRLNAQVHYPQVRSQESLCPAFSVYSFACIM